MYRQFSYYSSINTSERKFKIRNQYKNKPKNKNKVKNNKFNVLNYDSRNLFTEIYKKNRRNNWLPFVKTKTYFSFVPLLVSKETSIDYITNTKCCSPYHVYKKKGRYLYK